MKNNLTKDIAEILGINLDTVKIVAHSLGHGVERPVRMRPDQEAALRAQANLIYTSINEAD